MGVAKEMFGLTKPQIEGFFRKTFKNMVDCYKKIDREVVLGKLKIFDEKWKKFNEDLRSPLFK